MSRKRCGQRGLPRTRGKGDVALPVFGLTDIDLSRSVPIASIAGAVPVLQPCDVRMLERNIPVPENRSIM